MNEDLLVSMQVKHPTFGRGEVRRITDKFVRVQWRIGYTSDLDPSNAALALETVPRRRRLTQADAERASTRASLQGIDKSTAYESYRFRQCPNTQYWNRR